MCAILGTIRGVKQYFNNNASKTSHNNPKRLNNFKNILHLILISSQYFGSSTKQQKGKWRGVVLQ